MSVYAIEVDGVLLKRPVDYKSFRVKEVKSEVTYNPLCPVFGCGKMSRETEKKLELYEAGWTSEYADADSIRRLKPLKKRWGIVSHLPSKVVKTFVEVHGLAPAFVVGRVEWFPFKPMPQYFARAVNEGATTYIGAYCVDALMALMAGVSFVGIGKYVQNERVPKAGWFKSFREFVEVRRKK